MPNDKQLTEFILIEQTMGKPPSWLVRWGITIFVIFFSVVLGITAIISYPDVLKSNATTYLYKSPIDIYAQKSGIVNTLFVQDSDTIQSNDLLLAFQSTVDWKIVLKLDSLLKKEHTSIVNISISSKELGELNSLYQELILLNKKIKDVIENDITFKQIRAIHKEIDQNKNLNASLLKQKEVFLKELKNIKKDLNRSRELLKEGVISQQEFEQKENVYLQSNREFYIIESSIISNRIRIQQLEIQIPESEKQKHDVLFKLEIEFLQKKEILKTAIKKWKEEYLVYAPSSGTMVIPNQLQNGNQVITSEPLMTIMPIITQKESFLKATMDANGIGKIELGQKATVYFNNYPSTEYGTLKARVIKIAPIPTENKYEIILELPKDWITNYGVFIPKKQKMEATIAIQTKDYTLLERIFSGLLDAFKN